MPRLPLMRREAFGYPALAIVAIRHGSAAMLQAVYALVPEAMPWRASGWTPYDMTEVPDFTVVGTIMSVLYTRAGGPTGDAGNMRAHRLNVDNKGEICGYPLPGSKVCPQTGLHKHQWQSGIGGPRGCYVNLYQGAGGDDPWYLTEGEKDAAHLALLGYNSASYIGGSSNARHANYSPIDWVDRHRMA